MDEQETIELRSEKARNIIGKMPRSLTVWSYVVLCVVAVLLVLGIWIANELTGT